MSYKKELRTCTGMMMMIPILLLMFSCNNGTREGDNVQYGAEATHTFSIDSINFLLDGKPFRIISGEMHYSRIPEIYWRHRIKMAKAMGCNTIATYVFWSHHETAEGIFDFETGNRKLAEFIRIVQEEGMWMLFRPGPYACGEWDLGGIPPYLLSIPDIKLRCMDDRYMNAVERYIKNISGIIKPYLVTSGGPILMVQIENEYGSYGNDRNYLYRLKELWLSNGVDVPFYTSDGATTYMLEAGSLPGCAVGLDPCGRMENWLLARKMNPGVPVFSSETYPGWLTHWGEEFARTDTAGLLRQVRFLMDNDISVNFYVLHGGTNFGFTAGANSGGTGYQPDITSYDYDAPIDEQGRPTYKYFALRDLLASYSENGAEQLPMPEAIPVTEIPSFEMESMTALWDILPEPVASVQPAPFEYYGLYQGFALYRTILTGHKKGRLLVTDLHDYATVYVDGKYIGAIDRSKGENSIELPAGESDYPRLDILVEGMGRINFAQQLIDRKGITERVTLNGMTLMNWEVFLLPMDHKFISSLEATEDEANVPGIFFRGSFPLETPADTYIDMDGYNKGVVWVNGNNLGRYWDRGPQHSLYCPASFLREGDNEIIVFDLHKTEPSPLRGIVSLY